MTQTLLHIDASAVGAASVSRQASATLAKAQEPARIIYRDVANDALPHVSEHWVNARLVPEADRSASDQAVLKLSDALVAELQAAVTVVIGLPVYNFGMPASLKAWVDLVARPGVTFSYGPEGPVGLLEGKRAIIAVASGGTQIGSAYDFASTHLTHVLGFLGIKEVQIVNAKDYADAIPA